MSIVTRQNSFTQVTKIQSLCEVSAETSSQSEKDELSGKLTPRERSAQNEENSHTRMHIQTDSDGHSQSENLNTNSDEFSRSEKSDNTEKPSKSDIVLELSGKLLY